MQSTLENNSTKFRSKISSEFWEFAVFVFAKRFQPHLVHLDQVLWPDSLQNNSLIHCTAVSSVRPFAPSSMR